MFDVANLRSQFPAFNHFHAGKTPIFLDGPAGTQVPHRAIQAMVNYLSTCNANHGGVFATSQESDQIVAKAHEWTAAFLNAPSPEEIIFGQNMTSLTFHLSRAIGKTWKPGDEVMVTRLDHDANVSPWVLAARESGATVRFVDIREEDCTLNMADLDRQLSARTRLVAVTAASNLLGTKTDVAAIVQKAKRAGALVFVDAVHYAPHGPIDVQLWGCDFLACSAYKFFGPHLGILWGKRALLETLPAVKVRPAPETLPGRWMTGTQSHESLAGLTGTLEYLADIGKANPLPGLAENGSSLRSNLFSALRAIQAYEKELAKPFLAGLNEIPRIRVWGIADTSKMEGRVPTIAITHADKSPEELALHLAAEQVYAWNGNMYALELTQRLGVETRGGLLRMGLVHYNTPGEVDAVLALLKKL
jgi:cysteine desulfurase family protein (TIGR01976 family)